jgi:hypothetical protein
MAIISTLGRLRIKSLRIAWATQQVLGQPELHRKTLSQNAEQNKNKQQLKKTRLLRKAEW